MAVFNFSGVLPRRYYRYIFLLISAVAVLCLLWMYPSVSPSPLEEPEKIITINWPPKLENFEMPCEELLDLLTSEYVLTLILDTNFADKVNKKMNCTDVDYPSKMAVPTNVIAQLDKTILKYKNDPKKNYYLIYDRNYRRAIFKFDHTTNYIWREYRNALLPRNITLFKELWSRSQFKNCRKVSPAKPHPEWNMEKVLMDMTALTKYFMKFGMYPSLACGTLLGWYRECGFIRHTGDIDFYYRAEEYNPDAFAQIYETQRPLRLSYEYGKHNLNREYKFDTDPPIDLFEVVSSPKNDSSYIAVVAGKNVYWNIYPSKYTSNCVADLYGHMFWITCNPVIILKAEYGPDWMVSNPKMNYLKTKNLIHVRKYSDAEFQEFGKKTLI